MTAKEKLRIKQLEALVGSFVLEEIDYMTRNNLGDPEKQHNVKWARQLGIMDRLEDLDDPDR